MRPFLALALLLLTPPVALSDLDKAQAEKHRIAVQLLSCQEQLVGAQVAAQKATLTEAQAQLEARFRAVLKPADTDVFDWATLAFIKPAKE